MNLRRVTLPLFLTLTSALAANAQEGGPKPSSALRIATTGNALRTRASRAAVVRLKSGESLDCNFLRADEDTIEIEAAGGRRGIRLDEVASIAFLPRASDGKHQAATRETAPLVVTSRQCETFDGFTALKGEVRNTSSRRIKNLTAVGTFRSKSGSVVKVEQQLIGDVPAGEAATFKVMWWYDPRIESCAVSFKIFGGGPVQHSESEQ